MTDFSRENPSPRYRELVDVYSGMHEHGVPADGKKAEQIFDGGSLVDHVADVKALIDRTGARTILDYGSGKGKLYKSADVQLDDGTRIGRLQDYWAVAEIRCFDPGVPEYAALPDVRFDGVVCTDVLEHVPEEDVPWVLREIFSFAGRFVYANVAARAARKTLPNGWNAHVTVRETGWWRDQFEKAATGWAGDVAEIHIERKSRIPGFVRKITGTPKLRTDKLVLEGH